MIYAIMKTTSKYLQSRFLLRVRQSLRVQLVELAAEFLDGLGALELEPLGGIVSQMEEEDAGSGDDRHLRWCQ